MKKITSIAIVTLFLLSALQIGFSALETGVVIARDTESNQPLYTLHSQIRINNDTDFTEQAASEGWAGNGSAGNPYVIDNYEINASSGRAAIYIGNVTLHFTIRGCYLHDAVAGGNYTNGNGITLFNTENGTIENNIIQNNENFGVYISYGSKWNSVLNNNISYNDQRGLVIQQFSSNNVVDNNSLYGNQWYNINVLGNSNNNMISNNTLMRSASHGISIDSSNDTVIRDNVIRYNTKYGSIQLSHSCRAIIKNNTMIDYAGHGGIYISGDSMEYWNTHEIDSSNILKGRPVYYLKNSSGGTVSSGYAQVILANCTNVDLINQNLTDVYYALQVAFSSGIRIQESKISSNSLGIFFQSSTACTLSNNTISGNSNGIEFRNSSNNTVANSTISDNNYAILMYYISQNSGTDSRDNRIYHNNFLNNSNELYDAFNQGSNVWNQTYPSCGNFRSSYSGTDNNSGPGQNLSGKDGIGDSAYTLSSGNVDYYPLMSPWPSAPAVKNTSPINGETSVSLSADVGIVFNTSMNSSVIPVLEQISGTPVTYSFAGWNSTVYTNDTAVWTHADWNDDETIALRVCNYSDASGRFGREYRWSFRTVDLTAPYVISSTPADGAQGVGLSTDIVIVFSEEMNTSAVPTLSESTSSGVTYTFAGWSSTNVENDTATWIHGDWPEKMTLCLNVSGGEDVSGNTALSYEWSFTTGDFTAPGIMWTEPSDGETDVNKSINITVVFDETMNTSYNNGYPDLWFRNGTNPGGWVFLGWSSTNTNNDTASWSHNNFTEKDRVSLKVANYADISGNAGAGYEWTFYIEDTYAPHVISTQPQQGAVNVSESADVAVVFNESMNSSVILELKQTSGTPVNYSFVGWSTTYLENDTATWSHDNWSTANDISERSIELTVSNYSDLSGNIGVNYTWAFTVIDKEAPSVLSTDPADGDMWVPLDKIVTVVFSESMKYATLSGGSGISYSFLGWSTTNVHNDTGRWSHTDWPENTDLALTISNAQDTLGNTALVYTFTIHTDDLTPPDIDAATRPYNGQKQVGYGANVSVVFTESMNASHIPVLIQNSGTAVTYTFAGWFSTNVVNDTAVWTHDNWTDSNTVNLTVSEYYDPAGNIGDNYTWSFRVYDNTAPYVVSTSPYDGEINVSVDIGQITVTWSEPMDPYGTPSLDIISADGNRPGTGFYMWLNDTTAVFNITGNFSQEDHIEMSVYAVQDPYNNDATPYSWWFHTYDSTAPYVMEVYPATGDTAAKNSSVYVIFGERMNESVIPSISQASDDPGGWLFTGWETVNYNVSGTWKDVSKAIWSHNNWTSETVNLTVSGFRDISGNLGVPHSWEFNVSIYAPHAMIRINSNAEFASMAASEGWSGDGTSGNPYIIEGYEISGDDGRGGYCIYIGNTTVYFIIANNSLNYAWTDNPVMPYYPKASVVLYNVSNGMVENNIMNVQSDFGIYALSVENTGIKGNYIHDYWWNGMNINSSTLSIVDNRLSGNGNGIYLLNSPYSELSGNELYGSDNTGITLENSSYVSLLDNGIHNYSSGIVFDSGDGATVNITMNNNSMENCGLMIWGWLYEHWTSHIIENNTVNNRPLVFLNGVDDYSVNYMVHAGQIYIVDCYNISVSEQFLVRSTVGIYVAASQLVTIINSTIAYNSYGIYMIGSAGNTVWHNNFVGNDVQAWDDGAPGDNSWDSGYPYGGNYWDDYAGNDSYSGPNQDIPGSDGIGDTQRSIDGGSSLDNYPLMNATEIVIQYTPGWHMVAFPWLIDKTVITDALSGASWDRAMIYLNGTWKTYNANRAARYNLGFPLIDRTMGLWVNFTDYSTLSGPSPIHTGNITIYIHSGWNLIEGAFAFQLRELLNGVDYSYVQSANLTDPSVMEDIPANETLVSGRSYWVYVERDYTIVINTDDFTVQTMEGIVPQSAGSPPDIRSAPLLQTNSVEDAESQNITVSVAQPQELSTSFVLLPFIMAALGTTSILFLDKRRKRSS